jgi:hypothetical protein
VNQVQIWNADSALTWNPDPDKIWNADLDMDADENMIRNADGDLIQSAAPELIYHGDPALFPGKRVPFPDIRGEFKIKETSPNKKVIRNVRKKFVKYKFLIYCPCIQPN